MTTIRLAAAAVTLCMLLGGRAFADEVWIVRVLAQAPRSPLATHQWGDDTRLYNPGATDVTATLLDLSNGAVASNPETLTIPAMSTRTPNLTSWQPSFTPSVYVVHLGFSGPVIAAERLVYEIQTCFPDGTCDLGPHFGGAVRMPTFRNLVPAGQAQILLFADAVSDPGHGNIEVYNAGAEAATVVVDVMRACDDTLDHTITATISAATIMQVATTGEGDLECLGEDIDRQPGPQTLYARITSTQPGFSLVSLLTATSSDFTIPVSVVGSD